MKPMEYKTSVRSRDLLENAVLILIPKNAHFPSFSAPAQRGDGNEILLPTSLRLDEQNSSSNHEGDGLYFEL